MKNKTFSVNRWGGTATAVLLAFLLFYFPSVLSLFSHEGEPPEWSLTGVIMATFYSFVFCVNYFLLVPWLLRHPEKRSLFFLLNILLILADCCLISLWFEAFGGIPMPKGRSPETFTTLQRLVSYLRFIMRDGIMMVLSATLAYALRLSEARERMRHQDLELRAEQRRIELQNLKAQLNPHFLFNSLNNIYALIGFAPERAQSALHDLSNMLRFMIYDSGNTTVPLAREMQFISDYSALMKLRLNSNIEVRCDVLPDIMSDISVTPLLFLTLVENAFKHVAPLADGRGFIDISMNIADSSAGDASLVTTVENTFAESQPNFIVGGSKEMTNVGSGVGLENVRKQLNLLYPQSHTFLISQREGIFKASISISLSVLRSTLQDNKQDKTDELHNN